MKHILSLTFNFNNAKELTPESVALVEMKLSYKPHLQLLQLQSLKTLRMAIIPFRERVIEKKLEFVE